MMRFILVPILCCASCSTPTAGIIRGYVVGAHGRRVAHAHVTAAHLPPTDQHPPQLAKKLGTAMTDSHGEFLLSVSQVTRYTLLVASFDEASGAAAPSFDHPVRIALRHNQPRVVP
jgi:hypothetical protein